ncbi:MAG: hypothetical protein V8S53_12725 [Lachnospiraceae bacterium]
MKKNAGYHAYQKTGEQIEVDWAVTLPTSLIRTPEKSQMHGYL